MSGKGWFLAGAVALAALTPPPRSQAKALLYLSEILPGPVKPLKAVSAPPMVEEKIASGGRVLVFNPDRGKPAVVLVHGANLGGVDDPRVRTSAEAMARLGRTVVVPSLALGERRLDRGDLGRIRESIRLAWKISGQKVVVLSFSFGSAFTLVALQHEPHIQRLISAVFTVGTYFDIGNLISGVTTGRVSADDSSARWSGAPGADLMLASILSGFLDPSERDAFTRAYPDGDASSLPGGARNLFDLMVNDDPDRVPGLLLTLPGGLPQLFKDLSPASAPELIRVPVHAMHSIDDPAAPASESELLVKSIASRDRSTITMVGSFRHVTPTGSALAMSGDSIRVVSFAARLFRYQEKALAGLPR